MKYSPQLEKKEIQDNHAVFEERMGLFKKEGLDFRKSRERLLDRAGDMFGSILEIGCGRGVTALSLAGAGYTFTGIDNNPDMLKLTAMNLAYYDLLGQVDLRVMDTYAMDFNDNCFDNVVMVEALHHMKDAKGVLAGIDRVLAEGGKLVLMDFNDRGRSIVEKVHADEGKRHEGHFSGKGEARTWLLSKGYDVREHEDDCHWIMVAEK